MPEENQQNTYLEQLLATTARIFADEGSTREVAILASADASFELRDFYDSFGHSGSETIDIYCLNLKIPSWTFSRLSGELDELEASIKDKVNKITPRSSRSHIGDVNILPIISASHDWREKAKRWVAGDGINNQGRVRSDNIPSKQVDGLLFRSEPEIFLYKAFKSLGVSFAPLPVFVRGGESYKRIEPDFVIVKSGVIMVVEVDGDTVHHETPAEAHDRTTMLAHEGVKIERVKASECSTQDLANVCAKRILQVIEKLKAAR